MTFEYIAMLVPTGFVALYCAVQSTVNFRERRYGFGSVGVISTLFALFWLVTMVYNVALEIGAVPSVRVIN
jgi:hypothetical protein